MIGILEALAMRDNSEDGDYKGSQGFLMCGDCHTRKEMEIIWVDGKTMRKVPIACECQLQAYDKGHKTQRHANFLQLVERLKKEGLTDPAYRDWTFRKDDKVNPLVSEVCRKYAYRWDEMYADGAGLLFFGGVGTGKTFYSCCIANEIIERGISALVTSFPRILRNSKDKEKQMESFKKYDLLVIDDLGAERNTEYGLEVVYDVIDSRYRSKKPLIITTNLSPEDIKKPEHIGYQRIYDRIMQNCIPVKMDGQSRRKQISAVNRDKWKMVLGL